ncbi:MAG: hypothetical protein WDN72_05645 [Alphaproteobacteria bacterium]
MRSPALLPVMESRRGPFAWSMTACSAARPAVAEMSALSQRARPQASVPWTSCSEPVSVSASSSKARVERDGRGNRRAGWLSPPCAA